MARRSTAEARKAPRQERAKATVDAILRAAAHILREEGYEACSTNRVALKAGVSIGSLYQYYPSKEALVMALAERHSEQAYGLLLRTASEVNGAPLKVAVRKFIEAMGELHKMDPKLHRVLTEHTTKIGGFEAVKRLTLASATFVRGYLESLGPQIRKCDLDTATFVVVTTVEAVTHISAMETEHGPTEEKLVDELTHLVLRYLEPNGAS